MLDNYKKQLEIKEKLIESSTNLKEMIRNNESKELINKEADIIYEILSESKTNNLFTRYLPFNYKQREVEEEKPHGRDMLIVLLIKAGVELERFLPYLSCKHLEGTFLKEKLEKELIKYLESTRNFETLSEIYTSEFVCDSIKIEALKVIRKYYKENSECDFNYMELNNYLINLKEAKENERRVLK